MMKNRMLAVGVLLMVVALAAGLMGCEHDPVSNATKFEGTWRNQGSNDAGTDSWDLVYTFTDNAFTYDNNRGDTVSGTFTFTDTTITFSPEGDESWTQNYTLAGNNLYLEWEDGGHANGTFTLE
jgi:hypothetical protein